MKLTSLLHIPGVSECVIAEPHLDTLIQKAEPFTTFPDLSVEICGSWVWITGNTFHHRKALSHAGFKYQKEKQAWSFHINDYCKPSHARSVSLPRIRERYGTLCLS